MDQIIRITSELKENSNNIYELVCKIAELAKKFVDEKNQRKQVGEFDTEVPVVPSLSFDKNKKPVQQAIIVRASEELNDGGLVS